MGFLHNIINERPLMELIYMSSQRLVGDFIADARISFANLLKPIQKISIQENSTE